MTNRGGEEVIAELRDALVPLTTLPDVIRIGDRAITLDAGRDALQSVLRVRSLLEELEMIVIAPKER